MAEEFNPYRQWLGIQAESIDQIDHYQLLGVDRFEDSAIVISEAALRQTEFVKSHELGPHASVCQDLLTQLAIAKSTLTDSKKKRSYDAELAGRDSQNPGAQRGETISDLPLIVRLAAPAMAFTIGAVSCWWIEFRPQSDSAPAVPNLQPDLAPVSAPSRSLLAPSLQSPVIPMDDPLTGPHEGLAIEELPSQPESTDPAAGLAEPAALEDSVPNTDSRITQELPIAQVPTPVEVLLGPPTQQEADATDQVAPLVLLPDPNVRYQEKNPTIPISSKRPHWIADTSGVAQIDQRFRDWKIQPDDKIIHARLVGIEDPAQSRSSDTRLISLQTPDGRQVETMIRDLSSLDQQFIQDISMSQMDTFPGHGLKHYKRRVRIITKIKGEYREKYGTVVSVNGPRVNLDTGDVRNEAILLKDIASVFFLDFGREYEFRGSHFHYAPRGTSPFAKHRDSMVLAQSLRQSVLHGLLAKEQPNIHWSKLIQTEQIPSPRRQPNRTPRRAPIW